MSRRQPLLALGLAAVAAAFVSNAKPAAAQTTAVREGSRPHITIHPRQRALPASAKRYCRSWLAQEYRVSGPVIVTREYCWWR